MSNRDEVLRTVGGYSVIREVSQGPRARVYRARHSVLQSDHALKIADLGLEAELGDAMLVGAELQAQVHHPHVVRVTDAGRHAQRPWIVMDWAVGGTLAEWIDETRVDRSNIVKVFRSILRGVKSIHDVGVVHRNLKPKNVLMAEIGRRVVPRLTDFSLAKSVDSGSPRPTGLSVEYRTLGTPGYMAPEQYNNAGVVDPTADIFSLGSLFYELVSGASAFDFDADEPDARVMARAEKGDYVPLRDLAAWANPSLSTIVDAMLHPEPDARPSNVHQVLEWLDGVET